jgi:hypothetical protein
MELLPDDLRRELPRIRAQHRSADPIVYIKYFTPDSNWTWWVVEGQAEDGDFRFFGFVRGHDSEWGCFMLSELTAARGPMNLPIERDLFFEPGPFHDVVPAPD